MSGFHFHRYENAILVDKRLKGTARDLYDFMLAQSHIYEGDFVMSIAELAEGIMRSPDTTRSWLNYLIALGLVTRIFRKDSARRKWNLKSRFIVHQVISEETPQEQQNLVEYTTQGRYPRFFPVPPLKNQEGEESRESLRDEEITLTREADTAQISPISEATLEGQNPKPQKPQPEEKPSFDLTGVPEIMQTVAEYWLFKTGKTSLTAGEVEVFCELAGTHMPVRIQKEIDKAVARWEKAGKAPAKQNFAYIGKALSCQRSYDPEKKRAKSNKKVSATAVKTEQVDLVMPIEEAQVVVAEYVSASQSAEQSAETVPAAIEEFYERIRRKSHEAWEKYESSLPKDEEGDLIWPEYETDEEAFAAGSMTVNDYLHAKFPDASEAELSTETLSPCEQEDVKQAFEIDCACAQCEPGNSCGLPPQWCANKKRSRPVVMLRDGKLCTGYSPDGVRCKHECGQNKPDPALESRLKNSGLTERQAGMTLAAYSHENATPDVVVAKAKAILAVKNSTNLILAGKPGTGKTHLAIGIAQEAMKAGRGAIVKTLPEMLDEICDAYRANVDPLRVMMKYKTIPCLVIDDWGKEKTSEARQDYLYQIIDGRYQRGLQTIVTTNALCPEELAKPWDKYDVEALISRILENGEWVSITEAPNWRLKREEPPAADDCLAEISAEEEEAWKVMRETIDDAAGTVLTPEEPKRSYAEYLPGMTIIHVPHYDDGLDDETDI